MKSTAQALVEALLEANGYIEPFSAIPGSIRKHLLDNIYEHVEGSQLTDLLRHIHELSVLVVRHPVAHPNGKWWIPVIDNGALLGTGPWFKSYVPDKEALITDSEMVRNPILPPTDRRNWYLKLQRIRPWDAPKIMEDSPAPRRLAFQSNVYNDRAMNPSAVDDASIDRVLRNGTVDDKIVLLASMKREHPRLEEVWCAVFGKPENEMTVTEGERHGPAIT